MHRVDTSGHVANQFSDGVPGVTAATVVDEDILNAFQEELANAIEDAGITLVKGTNDQLAAAILATIRTIAHTLVQPLIVAPVGGATDALTATGTGGGAGMVGISGPTGGPGTTGMYGLTNANGGSSGMTGESTDAASTGVYGKSPGTAVYGESTGAGSALIGYSDTGFGLELQKGNAKFSGANPAVTTAFTNTATPTSILKACGKTIAGTLQAGGFNVASAVGADATLSILVTLASAVNDMVVVPSINQPRTILYVQYLTTTTFKIWGWDEAGAVDLAMSGGGAHVGWNVTGSQ